MWIFYYIFQTVSNFYFKWLFEKDHILLNDNMYKKYINPKMEIKSHTIKKVNNIVKREN